MIQQTSLFLLLAYLYPYNRTFFCTEEIYILLYFHYGFEVSI